MVSFMSPTQAVKCPAQNLELVSVSECRTCLNCLELRQPWRYFVVKCAVGNYNNTPKL